MINANMNIMQKSREILRHETEMFYIISYLINL